MRYLDANTKQGMCPPTFFLYLGISIYLSSGFQAMWEALHLKWADVCLDIFLKC